MDDTRPAAGRRRRASPWRRSLGWSTLEGTLGAASDNLALPYVGLFVLAAGGGPPEVSLAAAVPALVANLLQVPFGWVADRRPALRKALWLAGSLPSRLLWAALAVLPWWWPGHPQGLIRWFLILLALRAACVAAATPAWTSLLADLTHRRWRGAYLAWRNVLANLTALAGTVAAGYLAELGYPRGYAWLFGAAALTGLLASLAAVPVQGQPGPWPGPGSRLRPPSRQTGPSVAGADRAARAGAVHPAAGGGPGAPALQRPFTWFAATSVLWNFAVNLPVPLFPVHFTRQLHGTPAQWGLANGATILTTILGQRAWGRRLDRQGGAAVLAVSGAACSLVPVLWALAPGPWWVVALNLYAGYAWAGYNLAVLHHLLEVTPREGRASRVGMFNMGVGVASAAGPLVGTWLAGYTGMVPVMLVSAALRAAALGLFVWGARGLLWGGRAGFYNALALARAGGRAAKRAGGGPGCWI
ncbi:MAG TPA: MFS transporter [Limnochordales bacterium]